LQIEILHKLWPTATEAWQFDLEAILPDIPYVGITLTMSMESREILQQNRYILHGIPAMGSGGGATVGNGSLRRAFNYHCCTADLRGLSMRNSGVIRCASEVKRSVRSALALAVICSSFVDIRLIFWAWRTYVERTAAVCSR
jgi:hypothetical protein